MGGGILRQMALFATGLIVTITLGFSGLAGATTSIRHIEPYDKWTGRWK
jgi:hypothetical protein